jgi:hypothetical protein
MGENTAGKTDLEAAQPAVEAIGSVVKYTGFPSTRELGVEKEKLEILAPQITGNAITSGSPANNPPKWGIIYFSL